MPDPLQQFTEEQVMKMEDDIYRRLCGNALTGEVAAWLSIFHSHFLRLNNRVHELERQLQGKA